MCYGCNKKVGLKGWNEDRRTIYDLHGMIYLLMYNYICNTVGCEHFHKQMNVYTKVKSEDKRNVYMLVLSDSVRSLYYDDIILTHKSGCTKKFMHYIVTDAMSSKSFYSTCESMQSFRVVVIVIVVVIIVVVIVVVVVLVVEIIIRIKYLYLNHHRIRKILHWMKMNCFAL